MQSPHQLQKDSSVLEGEWNFKGYFPTGCRELPECFVHTLGFKLDKTQNRDGDWECLNTMAQKSGASCKAGDEDFKHYGFTWKHGDKISYGGRNGKHPGVSFDFVSQKMYYDQDAKPAQLYIQDKGDACWIGYEKTKYPQHNIDKMSGYNEVTAHLGGNKKPSNVIRVESLVNPAQWAAIKELEHMERPKLIKIPSIDEFAAPIETRASLFPAPIRNLRDYFVFGTTLDPKKWAEERNAELELISQLEKVGGQWKSWRNEVAQA